MAERLLIDMEASSPKTPDAPFLIVGDYYQSAFGPTILLILRSADACKWLGAIFHDLASGECDESLLSGAAEVNLHHIDRLALRVKVSESSAVMVVREKDFEWTGSMAAWKNCAELLDGLRTSGSGHHYLSDTDGSDAVVEVSLNEPDVISAAKKNAIL